MHSIQTIFLYPVLRSMSLKWRNGKGLAKGLAKELAVVIAELSNMVLTTGLTLSRFFDVQAENAVPSVLALFQRLDVDDQLSLFWQLYIDLRCLVTPVTPSPVRLQQAEGLLNHMKSMSPVEQLQAMRHLVSKANTPVSRAYGILSATTRLAFWYQLAECITAGIVVPVGSNYPMSASAHGVLQTIEQMDIGQQVTVLRSVVVNMGIDPLAL